MPAAPSEPAKISVVVIGFNIEQYVDVALKSVIRQTLQAYEVIFVDDGSTDGTQDRAKGILRVLPRWQLICQGNRGAGVARNSGFRAVSGDYVVFLDGDDWLEVNALELLANAVKGGADAVFSNRRIFHEVSDTFETDSAFDYASMGPVQPKRGLLRRFTVHGKMFRSEFLRSNLILFPNHLYWEDYPFSYDVLIRAESISVILDSTYIYRRRRADSLSASKGRRLTPLYIENRKEQILGCMNRYAHPNLRARFPKFNFLAVEANLRLMYDIKYLIRDQDETLVAEAFIQYRQFLKEQPWILREADTKHAPVYTAILDGDLQTAQSILRSITGEIGPAAKVVKTSEHRRMLLISLQDWPFASRIPKLASLVGFKVASCAPKYECLNLSSYLEARFQCPFYAADQMILILEAVHLACKEYKPDFVIACDDVGIRALNRLYHKLEGSDSEDDAKVRDLLISSKGSPEYFHLIRSKHLANALAHKIGIRAPRQRTCRDYEELRSVAEDFGLPLVVKGEHGMAGLGVRICSSNAELLGGWERAKSKGDVAAQEYVAGDLYFSNSAAYSGKVAATNVFQSIKTSGGVTGPSSVIQSRRHAEIEEATRIFVEHTGYSGILSLDFIVNSNGEAYFLECNPRPINATHLGRRLGNDLFHALYMSMNGEAYKGSSKENELIALFPREWKRDPASRYLWQAFHDVPWDEPAILKALMR